MRASTEERCGEHGALARVRYSDLKEAARVAADAGVMQIQLRKVGLVAAPRGVEQYGTQPGDKKSGLKAQMWCGKDDLAEWERRMVGWEDTRRGGERKQARVFVM